MSSAERLGRDGEVAGVAGLAYQAIDLASKALTEAIDGADAGSHAARMQRVKEIIQADQSELAFLWEIRQRDFYGDSTLGAPRELPTAEQVQRALAVARSLIDRIAAAVS
jgi:Tfp pilus assembly PilM family ATPase